MDTLGKFNFRTVIWLQKQFNFNKTDNFGQHIYFCLMNLVNWYVTKRAIAYACNFCREIILIFTNYNQRLTLQTNILKSTAAQSTLVKSGFTIL